MKSISSLNIRYGSGGWPDNCHPLFDDLEDHVAVLSEAEAKSISQYMDIFRDDSGIWMSYPPDPFDEDYIVERNEGDDGQYLWSGLTHYLIEKYRVDPPMEFRQHVREMLASGKDLNALAKKLRWSSGRKDPATERKREWLRIKARGGVRAAWALYP